MQSVEWKWKSRDGLEMYAHGWAPEAPKAVVALVHGFGEHVNRYAHVAAALTTAGYALQGFDLRGHGQSGGQRGHTPSYENLLDDITDFLAEVRQRFPGLPVFLYGHSMGGNLVSNYALRFPEKLKGAIVTSPWLKLAFDPPAAQVTLAKVLNRLAPGLTLASTLDVAFLSRDAEVVRKYVADPLVHSKITVRLYSSIYASGLWALEHAAELKIPMYLAHGTGDKITSAPASQEFAQKAGKLVTLRLWEGLFHETHNEPEQAEVLRTLIDWLDGQS